MAKYILETREGSTRERMEDLMYDIAAVESGRTFDPSIKQIGGGPGRGIFQYEGAEGSNRAKDAVSRAIDFYKNADTPNMPDWLKDFISSSSSDYDFSKLTIPQQKSLFLADYSQSGTIPFGAYMKGESNTENMWAEHHKVLNADRPHFRKLERLADADKNKRTVTDDEIRSMMLGKSFMPR